MTEAILLKALYEIACGQEIQERDEMIDYAADTICDYMSLNEMEYLPSFCGKEMSDVRIKGHSQYKGKGK